MGPPALAARLTPEEHHSRADGDRDHARDGRDADGALLVGGLATWLMGRLVKSTGLSGTDRLLGLGFGLLRGAALGCVLVLLLGFTPLPQDAWWRESQLLPGFQRGAEWLRSWLPEAVARHVRYTPALPTLPLPSPPDPEQSDNSAAPPR